MWYRDKADMQVRLLISSGRCAPAPKIMVRECVCVRARKTDDIINAILFLFSFVLFENRIINTCNHNFVHVRLFVCVWFVLGLWSLVFVWMKIGRAHSTVVPLFHSSFRLRFAKRQQTMETQTCVQRTWKLISKSSTSAARMRPASIGRTCVPIARIVCVYIYYCISARFVLICRWRMANGAHWVPFCARSPQNYTFLVRERRTASCDLPIPRSHSTSPCAYSVALIWRWR